MEVARSTRATPAARVAASRTLLELLGDLKRTDARPEERQLHELTEAELDAEIARLAPDVGVNVGVTPQRPRKKRATSST